MDQTECQKLAARFAGKADAGMVDVKFTIRNRDESVHEQVCAEANRLYDAVDRGEFRDFEQEAMTPGQRAAILFAYTQAADIDRALGREPTRETQQMVAAIVRENFYSDFAARQERLGIEFEKAIFSDLEGLYEP